jgi:hypothetical protein
MISHTKTIIFLAVILCLSSLASCGKLKLNTSQTINPLLDLWSDSYLYTYPSAFALVTPNPNIYNSMVCPPGKGAIRGFQTLKRTDVKVTVSNADYWAFKFQCSPGDSLDFVDVKAPMIRGVSTYQTKVDVCKTSGPGHILVPTGNTCTCPDNYVINSIRFINNPMVPNPIGISCTCAKVKPTAKLVCSHSQTNRMNINSFNGKKFDTIYDFLQTIPVYKDKISVLKDLTISFVTQKNYPNNPDYKTNALFWDYTTCYDSNSSAPSNAGPENIDTTGITDLDKYILLYHTNRLRNAVANQSTAEAGTKLPPAKNMRQVYWSDEIAKKAQEWANKCTGGHSSKEFRTLSRFSVGENLYSEWSPSGVPKTVAKSVVAWYGEIKDYVSQSLDVENFQDSKTSAVVGHFTQLVWAESYLMGCGFSVYMENGMKKNFYVCQYGPQGNYMGRPMYLAGKDKSDKACPAGTVLGTEWSGLCCATGKCTSNDLFM